MEIVPTIIQVAAWIYVIKQFLPFVLFPVIVIICYFGFRLIGFSHTQAIEKIKDSVAKGIRDAALNDQKNPVSGGSSYTMCQ